MNARNSSGTLKYLGAVVLVVIAGTALKHSSGALQWILAAVIVFGLVGGVTYTIRLVRAERRGRR
jgi:type IV secretory pathway VirB2 component (pilin)